MNNKLIVVDIGNTSSSFGIFPLLNLKSLPRPQLFWEIPTKEINSPSFPSRFGERLKSKKLSPSFISGVMVSSVVPWADEKLKKTFKKNHFVCLPHFVSAKSGSRVKVRYQHPSEVGADRIMNARAAMEIYPHHAAVVVDFGTATTFDCVSAQGEYLGGVIAPGPVISAEALFQKTAKLPLVLLNKPVRILGRNTLESIESGLYHGYRGLVQEIVTKLKEKMGSYVKVVATGGQADWILKGVKVIDRFVPEMTLLGLYHTWWDLKKRL